MAPHRRALLGAALLPALPLTARAQAFPTQSLRLIPPYPPGGGTDTVARLLLPHLMSQLGQNIVVENRGGAGGSIGAAEVARSPKDGHTLLLDSMGHVVNPTLMPNLPFDYATAFAPITQLTWQPQMLVVPAASPYRTLADLVAGAKARPGTLSYASSGNGTGAHLAMVEFARMAGIEVVHIPYRGGGPAMTDLIAGNVAMAFASAAAATAHVQGGRLRALGAAGLRRITALPDMPTISDQGYTGFDWDEWNGLWTVAGSPRIAVERLHAAAIFALAQPDVRTRMDQIGIVPLGTSPDDFAAFVIAQRERAARLIRDANITLG
ncbi:Bug family tripartite tricarboxylate transporter substrate binding protein [Neoroseomonas oryzicola]|uniref:Twin-arginine translocation pathway signal protein n=1 Tax=Neoroseomonas oryzicola TaxID=535904 RepID=A0A9X9WGE8_9PROT|nr:tripartite tricarboxylate transporter substrate-binding protein [Neoroseomonas oryzicola]MBR0659408.1 twin-arginine translocation pathway signal protein [Neoroseomonas oryzicola]NKE16309.1 twin-arginine translocation pathway signal protein [Neoroseomonas oryzicola]